MKTTIRGVIKLKEILEIEAEKQFKKYIKKAEDLFFKEVVFSEGKRYKKVIKHYDTALLLKDKISSTKENLEMIKIAELRKESAQDLLEVEEVIKSANKQINKECLELTKLLISLSIEEISEKIKNELKDLGDYVDVNTLRNFVSMYDNFKEGNNKDGMVKLLEEILLYKNRNKI